MVIPVALGVLAGIGIGVVLRRPKVRALREAAQDASGDRQKGAVRLARAEAVLKALSDAVLVVDRADNLRAMKLGRMPPRARSPFVHFQDKPVVQALGPTFAAQLLPVVSRCRETGEPQNTEVDWDQGLRPRRFDLLAYPSAEEDVIVLLRDVTETHAFQNALQSSLSVAERVAVARADFLARVSHDMRNPLTGVIAAAGVLRHITNPTSEERLYVESITEAGNHLVALANDLAEFARLQAGPPALNEEPVRVDDIVGGVLDLQAIEAAQKGVRLVGIVAADVPIVEADVLRLRQILLNVIGNAVKFTDEGEVVARLRWNGDALDIEVRDTGTGIEPAEIPSLFDPYVQAKSSDRKQMGSGLGLAITKQWVDTMGGTISVQSEVDRGSVFRISLPLRLARVPPDAKPLVGHEAVVYCRDASEREGLRSDLEALGATVTDAETLSAAESLVSNADPTMVVVESHGVGEDEGSLPRMRARLGPRSALVALSTVLEGPADRVTGSILRPARRSRVRAVADACVAHRRADYNPKSTLASTGP